MSKNMIDILLSTYNGERYLEEQIQSLIEQSYSDWQLIVRDDGSTDRTLDILERYSSLHPGKIRVVQSDKQRLGSTLSFEALLKCSKSEYLMLCDQDDFWLPDKVKDSFDRITKIEESSPGLPVMVFTDLVEVDSSLKTVKRSFLSGQKINPLVLNTPMKVLALNPVAGCTTILNRRVLDFVLPFPSSKVVHDQWMAVNVAKFGVLHFLERQTILYRQHQKNVVGANNVGLKYFLKKFLQPHIQYEIYRDLIRNLNFRVSVPVFLWYKLYYSCSRTFSSIFNR